MARGLQLEKADFGALGNVVEEPKPWPTRPIPMHDESLTSWLCRLSDANGVAVNELYEKIQAGSKPVFDPDQIPPTKFLEGLAIRTMVPMERLQGMILDPLTPILRAWKASGSSSVLSWKCCTAGVRRRVKNQFCPHCLRDDEIPYFRLSWRLSFATVCEVHRIPLWDSCPACHGELDLQAVRKMGSQGSGPGIVFCRKCGTDLRFVEPLTIPPGEAETQKIVDLALMHQSALFEILKAGGKDIQSKSPTKANLMFRSLRRLVNKMISPSFITKLCGIVRSEWPVATALPDFDDLRGKEFDELSSLERLVIMALTYWDAPGFGFGFLLISQAHTKLPCSIYGYWKKLHSDIYMEFANETAK